MSDEWAICLECGETPFRAGEQCPVCEPEDTDA